METLREAFARLGDSAEPEPAPAPEPEIVKPEPTPVPAPEPEEDGTLGVWGTKQAPSKQPEKPHSENAYTFEKASSEHAYTFEKADDKTELEPESLPKPRPQPKPQPASKPQPQPEKPASRPDSILVSLLCCAVYCVASVILGKIVWEYFLEGWYWSALPVLLAMVSAALAYLPGSLGSEKRATLAALFTWILIVVMLVAAYALDDYADWYFWHTDLFIILSAIAGLASELQIWQYAHGVIKISDIQSHKQYLKGMCGYGLASVVLFADGAFLVGVILG